MRPALTPQQLAALQDLDACSVANAIETFDTRLRNEGFADRSVQCLTPGIGSMVGYAATLQVRGSAPPMASGAYADRSDWWDYVLALPEPRVLVIQDVADRPGLCALVGEVHMSILKALGCVGVVTNGVVRDLPASRAAGFHTFAGGLTVSHGYIHVVNVGRPVIVGGMAIHSGDLLHGDEHGVQSVPLDAAAGIPQVVSRQKSTEQAILALCRSPEFSVERLRALLENAARAT
jgi:4-hydroxy-4-methyl-2-oxoglutarate aldolase